MHGSRSEQVAGMVWLAYDETANRRADRRAWLRSAVALLGLGGAAGAAQVAGRGQDAPPDDAEEFRRAESRRARSPTTGS